MVTTSISLDNSYKFTLADKICGAVQSLQQKLFPKTVLIAGPYVGEFGFELMHWQGYIRKRISHYKEVHIITYPERDYLYPSCHVHYHNIRLEKAGYGYGLLSPTQQKKIVIAKAKELGLKKYDILTSGHLCTKYHRRFLWGQRFELFQEPPLDGENRNLAFHIRSVDKDGPDKAKNYPHNLADQLAVLCLKRGYKICCIGHPDYAYCPSGCEDLRSADLKKSVAAICSAKIVVGENSGASHLANLCGKPTVLWASSQWRIDFSLRWNPFSVPIFVAANNTHTPPPPVVMHAIDKAIETMRIITADYSKPCYNNVPQSIAYS